MLAFFSRSRATKRSLGLAWGHRGWRQLCQVIGAKQVRDVVERLVGEQSQNFGFDGYKRAPAGVNDVDSSVVASDKVSLPPDSWGSRSVGEICHNASVSPWTRGWRPISEPIGWSQAPRPPKSTARTSTTPRGGATSDVTDGATLAAHNDRMVVGPSRVYRTPSMISPSVMPVAQKKMFSPETRSAVVSTRSRS